MQTGGQNNKHCFSQQFYNGSHNLPFIRLAPNISLNPKVTRCVAIVGLYNSGSTAVAGVLFSLGVHLGNVTWAFEDRQMGTFLSTAWDEPRGNPKFSQEQRVQRLREWIVVQKASTKRMITGLKHPLLCRDSISLPYGATKQVYMGASDCISLSLSPLTA